MGRIFDFARHILAVEETRHFSFLRMNTPKQSIEPDASGLFYESRVAEALGVERKLLAKLRKAYLAESTDFERKDNNAVALTAQGLSRIEELLRGASDAPPVGKNRAEAGLRAGKPAPDVPAGPPPRERMTIERVSGANPQILLCAGLNPPRNVAVRVRENANFTPGMEIETTYSGGVWYFRNRAGSDESTVGRLPRGKGRW